MMQRLMVHLVHQEASFALKTNDPAGFNLVDVMAWCAHAPPCLVSVTFLSPRDRI
jgi:hypothetical protein